MNELFDKLILRIVFSLYICLILYFYRYIHAYLHPSAKQHFLKKFHPSKNGPETLHLITRLLGLGLIYSEFYFYISDGILYALSDFFIQATIAALLYIGALYIMDSIILYNFEYQDEILKRKNMAYSLVSSTVTLGVAYIMRTIIHVSNDSIVIFFFLWLLGLVLLGFASKSYTIFSSLPFNRLLIQKNIGLSLSYLGFFWGWVIIISSALNHEVSDIRWYGAQVILKILLSLIVFPIFKRGLALVFQIGSKGLRAGTSSEELSDIDVGIGINEGGSFFTSCLLTTIITGQIHFGTFYPVF